MRRAAWLLIRRGFNVVESGRCYRALRMKLVMLVAGIGARPGFTRNEQSAKILRRFGGKSLLHYRIEILPRILSSINNRVKTAIIKQTPDRAEKRIQ